MHPQNPFFLLRLPGNATPAEIKRAGQMALAAARLSGEVDSVRLAQVTAALEALKDPVNRLHAGVEWPSLSPDSASLFRGDPAFEHWTLSPESDWSVQCHRLLETESDLDQWHARAAFSLLRANALFAAAIQRSESAPDGSELATAGGLLSKGLGDWRRVTGSPEFWMSQRLRAKELADPRVGSELVAAIEARAMRLAADPFATLAQQALKARKRAPCAEIVRALKTCPGPCAQIEASLGIIYGPLCSRVESSIDALAQRLRQTTAKSAAPYRQILDEYSREIQPDIDLILAIGDLPGFSEEVARDKAAQLLRSISVAAANNADAYDLSGDALALAMKAVNGPQLRAMVESDRTTVANLARDSALAKKLAPLQAKLQAAVLGDDYPTAVAAVDELIRLESPESVSNLKRMRVMLTTAWATKLCNEGIQLAREGEYDRAKAKLSEALEVETVPSERRKIETALAAVRRASLERFTRSVMSGAERDAGSSSESPPKSQGCLIPLAIGAVAFVLFARSGWSALTSIMAIAPPIATPGPLP